MTAVASRRAAMRAFLNIFLSLGSVEKLAFGTCCGRVERKEGGIKERESWLLDD